MSQEDAVAPEDYLSAEEVDHFRGEKDHKKTGNAIMSVLRARLKSADGTIQETQEKGAFSAALRKLADESTDPTQVAQAAKQKAGDVAAHTGIKKGVLSDLIDDGTRSVINERRQDRIDNGDILTVPEGVGLDTYLEQELDQIVRQRSTDAVDDPILRWRFTDGVRIETGESIHHDFYSFFQRLAAATEQRLVPELASEQAVDELHEDEDVDGEAYARLSLGPESRPWHSQAHIWSRAISGLVEQLTQTETVVGPRTDAWESIQARIRTGRAVESIGDAINNGMMHIDQDAEEVWIPSTLIDAAIEPVETSRRAVQAELAERGVTSQSLSGARVSEPVSEGGTAIRFWRIDMAHVGVPEPETVLKEINDATDPFESTVEDSSGDAVADGGADSKVFGRDPEKQRSEDDNGDSEGDDS